MPKDFILFIKICDSFLYQKKVLKYKKQTYQINEELWKIGMSWRSKILGFTIMWIILYILLYTLIKLTSFYRLCLSLVLFLFYFVLLIVIRKLFFPKDLMSYLIKD